MPVPKKSLAKKPVSIKTSVSKTPFHFTGRKFNIIFILSVIGLCFVLYGNTIPNGFALDDEFVMRNDSIVAKGIKGIPELFKKRYAWDQKGSYGYRPMVKVSFALEYVLFKDSPHWGHFINILLYALVCLFIFYFFRKLLYEQVSDYFLLTMLALYITHPIHSEVVASLKNRDELLVFLFGFYSCYAMLRWFEAARIVPRALWGISGCLSLILGVLCKPDALIFLAITAMVLYFFASKGFRAAITSFLIMAMLTFIATRNIHHRVLPYSSYHRSFTFIENPLVGIYWYQKFPLAFSTVWFYISKMVFPKDLVSYYGYNAFNAFPGWTDFRVMAGILITLVLLYLVIKNIKKKTALLFMLLLFLGTAFPYTDITAVGAGIVAERFMFIPSVAFVFLITYLLFYIFKIPVDKKPWGQPAKYMYAIVIGVCVIFTARVLARNPNWKDHETLYLHDSMAAPNSAKLHALLAGMYMADAQQLYASAPQDRQQVVTLYAKAESAYQRSVDIYPGYSTSWNNIGMIGYTLYGDAPKAIINFEKAIQIDSGYTEAWFNRGACYEALSNKVVDTLNSLWHDSLQLPEKKSKINENKEKLNRMITACKNRINLYRDNSEKSYLKAIKLMPTYYMAYIYIARLYSSEKRYDKMIELDSNALKYGYQSDPIYITLGNALVALKDTDAAAHSYEKSVRFYNRDYYVCDFLQNYYYKKGDIEKSRYYKQLYDETINNQNRHTPQ